MPHGRRPARLASQLKEELGVMIQQKLRDPRIGFLTLTRVELTADLRWATVYFSVLGDEAQRQRSTDALHQAAGFLRHELRQNLQIRFVPELRFRYDNCWETQSKLEELFEQIHQQTAPETTIETTISEEKEPPNGSG
jgi:ribosome-binding factor A